MNRQTQRFFSLIILIAHSSSLIVGSVVQPPKLAVVIILDQCNYDHLLKHKPYLKGGIGYLLNQGIVYSHAYHPHALPETATGHATLSTGVYPKDHGIIGNKWHKNGAMVESDDDPQGNHTVFGAQPTTSAKSFATLCVDTLSDQFVLQSRPGCAHHAFSLALKSRAAVPCAGQLGKAIWFDNKAGMFTSSTAYFPSLPSWLQPINAKISSYSSVPWQEYKEHKEKRCYKFTDPDSYLYASLPFSLVDTNVPIEKGSQERPPYQLFELTPQSTVHLFEIAQECVNQCISKQHNDRLLLWISLSNLDKVGHMYGPDSKEYVDLLYHLDRQIKDFMHFTHTRVSKNEVLFVLTSDHGIERMPELLNKKGLHTAARLDAATFIQTINNAIRQQYAIDNVIKACLPGNLYLDHQAIASLDAATHKAVISDLKKIIAAQPGIKQVWHYDDLDHCVCEPDTPAYFFKNQRFPGRSGDLLYQTDPYVTISPYKTGASHMTPYAHDTHVPLIIFKNSSLEDKIITDKVTSLQCANSIAYLMGIPHPSASTQQLLPGITKEKTWSFR